MLTPMGKLSGVAIVRVGEGSFSPLDILSLVFYILNFLFNIFVFSYILNIFNSSIYLQPGCFSTFNYQIFSYYLLGNPMFDLFMHIFQLFPEWVSFTLTGLHIIYLFWMIKILAKFTFVSYQTNICFTGTAVCLVLMDSFAMISSIKPDIASFYILFSGILFFIFGIIAAMFYERRLTAKIKDDLSYPLGPDQEIEEMSSDEISNRFHEIGPDNDVMKSRFYLLSGLKTHPDLFVDFSFPIFCSDIFEDTTNLIFLLKAICFFITYSRLLKIASF
jgi:hypothetical protein